MNKNQMIIAKFIEKWGSQLPSEAWMELVSLVSELKDCHEKTRSSLRCIDNFIEALEERFEELKDSINELEPVSDNCDDE